MWQFTGRSCQIFIVHLEVMNGDQKIVLEVEQHIGTGVVRTVAMDTTDGSGSWYKKSQ
jgi:F0F1-type ATP synthase beta subunit